MSSTATANLIPPGPPTVSIQKRYRPEIEGLRIIAALLVAVYHIWFQKVSGGVDVFFVVSGFLVTTSLLSRFNREGRIRFTPYALNLARRLLPNALVVLLFVTVVSFLILPEVRHYSTMRELFASLFYYENWQLAATGTDYLDQSNEKSPVQHFWAMSIQGQFYILVFLTVGLAIVLTARRAKSFGWVLSIIFGALFATSLAFSIHLTAVNQPWAYFDTRTRFWEFLIGGLLTLVIFRLTLPRPVSAALGWIGLATLLSTGMLFDVGGSFPGWAALVPVGAAIMILLAGQNPTTLGVEKILGSRPMVYLGGFSYGLYLWHWSLLSFYYVIFDTKYVGPLHGVAIIVASLFLSMVSTTLVEKPMARRVSRHGLGLKGFAPIITLFLVVLISVTAWNVSSRFQSSGLAAKADTPDYPGAVAMQESYPEIPALDPIPALPDLKEDKAKPYFDGCHQRHGETEVLICEYGQTEDFEYTVALVGGSKATHWLPSLEAFAAEENIRILNVTKSGCRLSLQKGPTPDCTQWNEDVVAEVARTSPDLAIVLADTSDAEVSAVPQGFLLQFADLHDRGVPILAVRDTPTMKTDVPECLSGRNVVETDCGSSREFALSSPPHWERLADPPEYVNYVDYSKYLCTDDFCPAVIGNIVAYIDADHMSATFSRSMGPIIRQDVMQILERAR